MKLVQFRTLLRSHNSLVFFYRLISNHYYVRTILLSFPMQRFSLRNVVRMILVLSSQRFSVRKYVCRFITLVFSTFLLTLLARSHFTGLAFPRLSVSQCIRTIRLHFLVFLCTLVCSYGISLVFSTFIRTFVHYQLSSLSFSVIYCPTVIVWSGRRSSIRYAFLRNQFCLMTFLRKLVVAYFISLSVSSTCLCTLVHWQCFFLLQCNCNQGVRYDSSTFLRTLVSSNLISFVCSIHLRLKYRYFSVRELSAVSVLSFSEPYNVHTLLVSSFQRFSVR